MNEAGIQRKCPDRFFDLEAGWYSYDELSDLTGLANKSVGRIVHRCGLNRKFFRGVDGLGRGRKDMVLIFWPGRHEFEIERNLKRK